MTSFTTPDDILHHRAFFDEKEERKQRKNSLEQSGTSSHRARSGFPVSLLRSCQEKFQEKIIIDYRRKSASTSRVE